MKKALSCLLTIAMIFSFILPASAADNASTTSNTSSNVQTITQESFSDLFATLNTPVPADASTSILDIDYTYSVMPEENEDFANVSLSFQMNVLGTEIPAEAAGEVTGYHLSDGDLIWEGVIEGSTIINNEEFLVLVGFAKLDSSPEIQATVTIQGMDGDQPVSPVVFTFGDTVITYEIHSELMGLYNGTNNDQDDEINSDPVPVDAASSNFVLYGQDQKYFVEGQYDISGYAQRARGYFNPNINQFAVSLQSFAGNVDDHFEDSVTSGYVTTRIYTIEIGLEIDDNPDSAHAWIVGFEHFGFEEEDYGSPNVSLAPLFVDALSLLGVPLSTISATLNALKGNATHSSSNYTDRCYVSVDFGYGGGDPFDDITVGLPIIFQLDAGSSSYEGGTSVTFRTNIKYLVLYDPSGTGVPLRIPISGYETGKSVTIDLSV